MVTTDTAKQELVEFGLVVEGDDARLDGAIEKQGMFFLGPSFSLEQDDGEWKVVLGSHLAKWGRKLYFEELSDAISFLKEVYSDLPEDMADEWEPNKNE